MIKLTAQPGINHTAFRAAMYRRFDDWEGNVQICHAAQRARDGSKYVAIRINPLRGFELPADAAQVAQAVLVEVQS